MTKHLMDLLEEHEFTPDEGFVDGDEMDFWDTFLGLWIAASFIDMHEEMAE